MKKCIFAFICLFSLSAHAEKYLTYPDSPGTAVGFATQVVSYNPGSGASGNSALPKSAFSTGSWLGFNIDSQVDPLLSYPYVKIVDTSNSSSTVTGTDGSLIGVVDNSVTK
ncbi:MAG: hypothetical protein JO014_21265 [Metakosakonia sp.]|nr:hypothetical protein [Phytobacter sp.]MBV8875236.1 hypothetical protein [Phytobacter sp.]